MEGTLWPVIGSHFVVTNNIAERKYIAGGYHGWDLSLVDNGWDNILNTGNIRLKIQYNTEREMCRVSYRWVWDWWVQITFDKLEVFRHDNDHGEQPKFAINKSFLEMNNGEDFQKFHCLLINKPVKLAKQESNFKKLN